MTADQNSNTTAVPVICRLSSGSMPDILNIESQSDRPAWNEKLFQQEFQNEYSHFFGARMEGSLVGFLLCHAVIEEAHIMKFGVLPAYRRRGIGRHLIAYVIRDLHANAIKWATLEVRESNLPAKRLYSEVGFYEVGIRQKYYSDNGEDAIVMSINVIDFIVKHGDHSDLKDDNKGLQKAFHIF